MPIDSDYMTMREAREYLGVNHVKLMQFVSAGLLTPEPDIYDKRTKLVPTKQVVELAERRKHPKNNRRAA